MTTYHSHLIVREGWRLIAIAVLLGLVLQVSAGFFVAIPFWIATLVLGILFRDPHRVVPPKPLAIISPVDGEVTKIDTLQDPYTQSPMVQIQLNKGFFDVMIVRSPMEGKVMKQWFGVIEGNLAVGAAANALMNTQKSAPAYCEVVDGQPAVAGVEPTACRFAQWIQSDEQDDVVLAVRSAARLFKPRCYAHSGERIGQGQRCGIIPFASVVRVSVPASSRVEVKVGDTVRGGSDTLATLIH